ncbi:hypothetical protein ACMHYJ_03430 [Castellaniella hirudinis]|uniref:hypothetical protein n=1 Tax=Castellaniella hirudinis TaxID=1144617 RepID=UPI0039C08C78
MAQAAGCPVAIRLNQRDILDQTKQAKGSPLYRARIGHPIIPMPATRSLPHRPSYRSRARHAIVPVPAVGTDRAAEVKMAVVSE